MFLVKHWTFINFVVILFQKFPYQLLGINSLEEFHEEYGIIIFPYLCLNDENDYENLITKNTFLIKVIDLIYFFMDFLLKY